MHYIQRKIITLLMRTPTVTYAQLRPKGVESNHFAYHLEQLVKTGLVSKQDRAYSLTATGLALVDRVSHKDISVRKQPHIVTTIAITNGKGEMPLFKHMFQPYLGLIGFPQGRLHYEERLPEAATRELSEKVGLQGIPLKLRGIVYIYTTKQDQVISKIAAHVFSGSVTGTPALTTSDPAKGSSFWGDPDDYTEQQCMPGFWHIKTALAKNDGFFFSEIDYKLR